ncbi:DUF485 domain-containing protein [Rhodococcus sp. IEGM 1379]|uniref:DUF485 domain-containing protein n=1 Tax=Rhodococcus sp. IEGM 1379 TaxID=3047086 RepID=UPI0024B6F446|nr:DUF485 domain-containing protein [Rhodococcus sp. IEGM 1379]MDI9915191.1 DUF485 domain-containing protein [Rhodococcus sp. IEGM 1379]
MSTAEISEGASQERPTPDAQAFIDMQASPEFQELRTRLRKFVFPITAFFLLWYAVYVLLATYAHDFMATKVFGNVNLGIILGLGQFVTTFAITAWYVKFAARELDPRSAAIREELEGPAS